MLHVRLVDTDRPHTSVTVNEIVQPPESVGTKLTLPCPAPQLPPLWVQFPLTVMLQATGSLSGFERV